MKRAKKVKIYMNGDKLQQVPSFKYLGVVLDPPLNFNHHITSVVRTILHKMTLLSKMKKYLRNDTALLVYKTMLLPYFDYGDVIYCKSANRDLDKLQRLQNRCLKICMRQERNFSTDRAHKLASTPFLVDRRKAHVLNFMYVRKGKRHLLNTREIRTRAHDAPLFNVTIPRCEAYKRSVGYFGAVEWNNLSPEERNIDLFLAFKYTQKRNMLRPLERINLD